MSGAVSVKKRYGSISTTAVSDWKTSATCPSGAMCQCSARVLDNGVKFSVLGFINNVRHIVSDDRLVGWNLDNVHAVDFTELLLLGNRSTGHTGQLFIHTEQVLIGDGRQCLGFTFDLYALFCMRGFWRRSGS